MARLEAAEAEAAEAKAAAGAVAVAATAPEARPPSERLAGGAEGARRGTRARPEGAAAARCLPLPEPRRCAISWRAHELAARGLRMRAHANRQSGQRRADW